MKTEIEIRSYSPTKLAYEIYKKEREKIIHKMETRNYIVDVADQMTRDEFNDAFTAMNNEKMGMNPRQIAKELAKRQAYYATDKQAEKLVEAFDVMVERGDLPASLGTKIDKYEFLFGTNRAREAWSVLQETYEELVASGMTGTEAGQLISQLYFGS